MIPRQAHSFHILKVLLAVGVSVSVVWPIAACSVIRSPSPPPTFVPPPTATPPAGTTYTVRRGSVTEEIKVRGRVAAIREDFLYFPLDGRLKEIYFTAGQQVSEGELLAELDAWSLEGQVISARHSLDMRQLELDRALADPQLETVAVLEAQVRQAKLGVERAKIEATQSLADATQGLALAESALEQANIEAAQRVDGAAQTLAQARNALWQAQMERDAKKGDPNAGYTADVAEARVGDWESRVAEAQKEYTRAQELAAKLLADRRLRLDKAWKDLARAQEAAENRIALAQAGLDVAEAQLAKSTAPPLAEDVAIYQARVAQTRENLERLDARLAETRLYAPFDGVILSAQTQGGDEVESYDPIGAIGDPTGSRVVVNVPEEDIDKIAYGQPATVILDAYPDSEYLGHVIEIASKPVTWQAKKVYEVTIDFDDPSAVPGSIRMGCDVRIRTGSKSDVLVLLETALYREGRLSFVRLVEEGTVYGRVPVETGISGDGMVEIVSGLREGQVVLLH